MPIPYTFTLNINIDNSDYKAFIAQIQQIGGAWVKDNLGKDWFLPWPPAAISVEPNL